MAFQPNVPADGDTIPLRSAVVSPLLVPSMDATKVSATKRIPNVRPPEMTFVSVAVEGSSSVPESNASIPKSPVMAGLVPVAINEVLAALRNPPELLSVRVVPPTDGGPDAPEFKIVICNNDDDTHVPE